MILLAAVAPVLVAVYADLELKPCIERTHRYDRDGKKCRPTSTGKVPVFEQQYAALSEIVLSGWRQVVSCRPRDGQ